ncbi:acetoacetate decarboxylase family protein [uncultured Desulfosarcina sp.]|uniref:acetoacetate decarboxylase family protein n=1 Tax=uncultured Desulfosarcina sp. TaxID=218289 RepID=UPI0029C79A50|nr:acetoacetate decarboxylase family protein [uncultured Desulfosarcina sp.]
MKKNFFDVPRTYYTTSHTRTQVPMFFFKMAARIINYFIDYDRVLPKLEGTGLKPCRFSKNKAMVSLIFFNYQQVTIGGYDEVVITIMVYPEALGAPPCPLSTILFVKKGDWWGNLGSYVLEMPVTIPAARAAGREIWGFPKFLTTIPYSLAGNHFEFGVDDPDTSEAIVRVKGEMGAGFSASAFDLVSFNNYEDTVFRVVTEVNGKMKNCLCKGVEVKTGPSEHRMAKNIRDLGLEEAKPFAIMSSDYLQTRLNPGKPVADWKSQPLPYRYEQEEEFYKRQYDLLGENK